MAIEWENQILTVMTIEKLTAALVLPQISAASNQDNLKKPTNRQLKVSEL